MGIVTSGLVAEWVGKLAKNGTAPGNNTDPTGTWTDIVGSVDGTLNAADYTTTDGWVGDGTSGDPYAWHSKGFTETGQGYVTFATNQSPWTNGTFSCELWIYFTTTNAADNQSILDNLTGNTGYRIYVPTNQTGLTVRWGDGTTNQYDAFSGTMSDGSWNHLVITYDGDADVHKRYLNNGTAASTSSRTYSPNTTVAPKWSSSPSAGFHGSIATVRLYNTVLSATDVSTNYTAGKTASSLDDPPTLTTTAISAITATTATSGGTITNEGSTAVTDYGICWNTSGSPTVADSHTHDKP